MKYKQGLDRMQITFLPMSLDEYIPEEHICRVINAFTAMLDIVKLGFKYAKAQDIGCRPYNPRMMLNLYIYGYLNRIRSSRRLQTETLRNVEVMWLLEKLRPDDKTIANFRKDNSKALKSTFREFSLMCKEMDLYGGEVVAVDGTKIRANNSLNNNYNEKNAKEALRRIEKQISEYMKALEKSDKEEACDTIASKEKLHAALQKLNKKKQIIESIEVRASEPGGVSIIDPDAKLMKQGGDAKAVNVAYNIQTAVDDKNRLVVDFSVTDNSSDLGNLKDMANKARDIMGVETVTALADKGYYDGEDITACEKDGVACLVAKPNRNSNKRNKSLAKNFAFENFTYDRERDCYVCPCNQELYFKGIAKNGKRPSRRYYVNYEACRACTNRGKCVSGKYKSISRELHQGTLDIVDARTKDKSGLYRRRKTIVEHPFGVVKKVWGYSQFLCRTKPKVEAETALTFLAYNFRRVLTLFAGKNKELIETMRAI